MKLQEGSTLQGGKYRIESVLGQGGFGITYLAEQVGLNRQVAIKEFFMKEYCERDADTLQVSMGSSGSKELVNRFKAKFIKEAQTIAKLNHPNIIRIYDIFEENGTAYYVMEYHGKGSLSELLKSKGKLPESEALRYIRQVADALSYIHENKMNHLDVKPGNVLLDSKGNAVLIDFGVAKQYDAKGYQMSSTPVGLSEGYAPTEQYEKGGVNSFSATTDIYALGATMYCMVVGERPPKASIVLNEGLPALPRGLSSSVRAAIESAMQPKRNDRPQSIAEFLQLLEGTKKSESEATTIVAQEKETPKKRGWLYVAIACVVTVVVLVGGLSVRKNKSNEELAALKNTEQVVQQKLDSIKILEQERIAAEQAAAKKAEEERLAKQRAEQERIAAEQAAAKKAEEERLAKQRAEEERKAREAARYKATGCVNGHEYVDLGLSVKWATCNVGATSPEGYGDYFAWGETSPKSNYTWETYKFYVNVKFNKYNTSSDYGTIDNKTTLDLSDDAARVNWGGSWRLPTKAEQDELRNNCTWTWTTENGVNGYKGTSKTNGNSIFLPAAGFRNGRIDIGVGSDGKYCSSSLDESDPRGAYDLSFFSGRVGWHYCNRFIGRTVRAVCP